MPMTRRPALVVALVAAWTMSLLAPAVVLAAAPIAANDAYSFTEDVARTIPRGNGVLKNDTNAQSATKLTDPAHGTLSLQPDGGFTYAPAPDFFGTDSFTYQAVNADGSSTPTTVTLTVTPVNDAPSGTLDTSTATVAEDSGAASMPGRVTDISPGPLESDPVTFIVVAGTTALFSAQPAIDASGTLTFTPAANASGTTSVSVSISDGIAPPVALGSFSVQITAVPDAPVADDDSYATDQDHAAGRGGARRPRRRHGRRRGDDP